MLMTASNLALNERSMLAWNWTGPWEIAVILLAFLLLFGARKLPEMARGLARGLRTFKDEMKGIKTDEKDDSEDDRQEPPSDQANELPKSDSAADQDKS
jgi:sec-independent protein translocase protein TatA